MHSKIWKILIDGNRRYGSCQLTVDVSEFRRATVASKQTPIAAILGCSDSRVPPELVFDQGLGGLFVVRTAGLILDDAVMESLALGIREFQIPLLVVLGHARCGAVKYAMDALDEHQYPEDLLPSLVRQLRPSIEKAGKNSPDRWNDAARIHALAVADRLRQSPGIGKTSPGSGLEIITGWYDLDTGLVEMIHPAS
jgi:carbonic anhydrase